MKHKGFFLLAVFCLCALSACGRADLSTIHPGSAIGNFRVTTGMVDEVTFLYDLPVSDLPDGKTEIEIPWGTKVLAAYGVYDDQYSGKLDEVWETVAYTMEIDGRPVDLEAFGTIEKKHPTLGTMRHFNLVVEADKPGKLTMHLAGKVGDDAFDDTLVLNFLPPEK